MTATDIMRAMATELADLRARVARLESAEAGIVAMLKISETAGGPSGLAGTDCRVYMKGDKFIIATNNSSTDKFFYLDMAGTAGTWAYSATEP